MMKALILDDVEPSKMLAYFRVCQTFIQYFIRMKYKLEILKRLIKCEFFLVMFQLLTKLLCDISKTQHVVLSEFPSILAFYFRLQDKRRFSQIVFHIDFR